MLYTIKWFLFHFLEKSLMCFHRFCPSPFTFTKWRCGDEVNGRMEKGEVSICTGESWRVFNHLPQGRKLRGIVCRMCDVRERSPHHLPLLSQALDGLYGTRCGASLRRNVTDNSHNHKLKSSFLQFKVWKAQLGKHNYFKLHLHS